MEGGPSPAIDTPGPEVPQEEVCSFAGEWDTNFGAMTIRQEADAVQGDYGWDQGRIFGAMAAGTFTGRWSEAPTYEGPEDAGDVELTLSPDCTTFAGLWYYGEKDDHKFPGEWNGTRK
jgi:hypothetical protein